LRQELIEKGYFPQALFAFPDNLNFYQLNHDQEAPEDVEGVGGPEQKRARDYIVAKCGKR
jgi:hypothetical protein